MHIQKTAEEEQLRQLRMINAQLNPGPALLKFVLWVFLFLCLVFGAFGFLVQITRP
jgi:hypothetical protein